MIGGDKDVDILIAFDSKTGNVKRFVSKLDMRNVQITNELIVNEPFVLVTYTARMGKVPDTTFTFLEKNHKHLMGVSASGNKNWSSNYAKSADTISEMYNVPILSRFELSGLASDKTYFIERVRNLGITHRTE